MKSTQGALTEYEGSVVWIVVVVEDRGHSFAPGRARYEALLLPGLFYGDIGVTDSFRTCAVVFACVLLASCQTRKSNAPGAARVPISPGMINLVPGLRVDQKKDVVEFDAWTCIDSGWLEQVVCSTGTREHESLMVTDVPPSEIHAALLLLGLKSGAPGRWEIVDDKLETIAPRGPAINVRVRWVDSKSGEVRALPVSDWILDIHDRKVYPTDRWIFSGSILLSDEKAVRAGASYLADSTGSIIGLVTFGDEVLAAEDVLPDSAVASAPEWIVNSSQIPPPGTRIIVELEPVDRGEQAQPASGNSTG